MTTLGNGILWPFRSTVFLNIEALTAPTLKTVSGFDIFRLFLIDWMYQSVRSYRMMGYLYLSADAGTSQAESGRQESDLLGEATRQADRLEGRGMITSIGSETPTPQARSRVAGSQRAWAMLWAQMVLADGT